MKRKPSYEELQKRVRFLEKEADKLGRIKTKLEESEARFKDIADNALEWIWEVDTKGKYTYSSPVVEKILGYKPEEVLGKFYFDLFHPDDKRRLIKATTKVFEQKKAFRKFINRNIFKDGKTAVVLSTSGVPVYDAQGDFLGYRGADTDITDQYLAEKKLQESEEHLRSLMENATNFAVYRLTSNKSSPHKLRVIFVSPSAKDILGVDEPDKFESWFENIHPDDVGRITEANQMAFETRRFNEEFRMYDHKRNEWKWVNAISTGGVNKKVWNRYVNGILIDITERKIAEEVLKAKDKELEARANNLKEINTALNVLLKKRENDRVELEEKILLNVENLVKPYLNRLQKDHLNNKNRGTLNVISANLDKIISPFSRKLSSKYFKLTPKEIQIANLIKQGHTNKEMADILYLSIKTIEFHRDNIRKKLGIKNKKINLGSFLSSIQ